MRNTLKALFITGTNQYGVVTHFLKGMQSDLSILGIEVDELNVGSEKLKHQTSQNISTLSQYDFIVSFNAVGLDVEIVGSSVQDFSKIKPVFIFLVDHPIHLLKRYIGLNVKVLCIDQEHVGFCQLCNIDAVYFPHAVSVKNSLEQECVAVQDRNNEILFPVSFFDLESAKLRLKPVWHQVSGILETSTSITRFMQQLGVLPLGSRAALVPLDENIRQISIFADFYIRARSRFEFLKQSTQNGLQLTVIGRSCDKYKNDFPQHVYEDAMPFIDILERMSKARYVAHNSPGFERGLHERVVVPLSMGTLVVSAEPFIQQSFVKGSIQTCSTAYGLTDDSYQQNSTEAQLEVQNKDTWKVRWEKLLNETY
jgi:hypothetical protein